MTLQAASDGSGYMQDWQITSTGTISWVKPIQVQVVERFKGQNYAVFAYAAFATANGCNAMKLSGPTPPTPTTDSYDSSTGATPAAAYAASAKTTGGDVGSNGNLDVQSGSVVDGVYYSPLTGTGNCNSGSPDAVNSSTSISGGVAQLSAPRTFTTPPAPSPAPPTTSQQINSNTCPTGGNAITGCSNSSPSGSYVVLASGTYGNLTVSGNGTVAELSCSPASSPCVYNVNVLTVQGGAALQILGGGQVIINVAGAGSTQPITFSGGNSVENSGPPGNFELEYAGTQKITLSGGGSAAGIVNAPNSPITLSGGSAWFGSIVGSTITVSGGTQIHYDMALKSSSASLGRWHVSSFTWNKY
jgi:hypothetical protein